MAHKQPIPRSPLQLENYQANWDLALRQAKDDQERAALEPLSPLGKADVVLELRDAVCGALPQVRCGGGQERPLKQERRVWYAGAGQRCAVAVARC